MLKSSVVYFCTIGTREIMNVYAMLGALIMTLSFLAYGIGSVSLERFKMVGTIVLIFLSLGVFFDFAAVTLMIIGAKGSLFTLHAILGYSALLVMMINTAWAWKVYLKHGIDATIGIQLYRYTKFAYFWWVISYLSGIVIIIWR